jgi:dephospho-CoA kinase
MKKKLIIGINGFLGSGKTTVGNLFKNEGAEFIESDQVVSKLYEPGAEGWKKIVSFLGEKFLKKDGTINRRKLAVFVFEDVHKLRIVNNLIHPLVTAVIKKKIADSNAVIIAIEAVYFEKNQLGDIVDKIVWTECAEDIAKERIIKINKFDGLMFENIRNSQVRPEKTDFIVENNGDIDELRRQVKEIMGLLSVEH